MLDGVTNSGGETLGDVFPAFGVSAFGAYDVRGVIGENLTAGLYYRAARAAVEVLGAHAACVGFDARATSASFAAAALRGVTEAGCKSISLGLCGTEEVYFAAGSANLGLGLMVTASHNPLDYNGLKLVGPGARPLTDQEFKRIRDLTASGDFTAPAAFGTRAVAGTPQREAYAAHLADIVDPKAMGAPRILFDCGSGAAGPTLQVLLRELQSRGAQVDAVTVRGNPDPTFPDGVPNPLLPEMRAATARAVAEAGADFGVAFDGDFDRCFFFDASGQFVGGEYVVALLARATLRREPGASIVHDPRVVYAVREAIEAGGGVPVKSRTGHAFVKAAMRGRGAAYGGELSAHHYFRDFYNCDSGMIPWIMVLELLRSSGSSLSALVGEVSASFASSGEINFEVDSKSAAFDAARSAYASHAAEVDETDGLSCDMGAWRFNLRASNTENLIRLNVEARGAAVSVGDCVAKISKIIGDSQG